MTCQRCSNKAKEGTKLCPTHHGILAEYRRRYIDSMRSAMRGGFVIEWTGPATPPDGFYGLSSWTRDVAKLAELLR